MNKAIKSAVSEIKASCLYAVSDMVKDADTENKELLMDRKIEANRQLAEAIGATVKSITDAMIEDLLDQGISFNRFGAERVIRNAMICGFDEAE